MAERPLLILPAAAPAARARKFGGGGGPKPLGPGRQKERIGPRLDELEAAFAAKRFKMQTSASGLEPEDVLVLETAGTLEEFFKAANKVEGLEFLAEFDEEDIPADDDFFVEKEGRVREKYRGRVYLMFANQEAFRQLLRLWQTWQSAEKFERGLTKWRDIFALLRDIRRWGIRDRLEETGVLDDWRERVELGAELIPCEIEIWFRSDENRRRRASAVVRDLVTRLGGGVLTEATVNEIHYHGVAARLPISAIRDLLDHAKRNEIALVQCEQIQFIRASGQMAGRLPVDTTEQYLTALTASTPSPAVKPAVALLDGMPLQGHRTLVGRLSIDDPDDFGSEYEARTRLHGTSMASLIIWGDLNGPGEPIPQPLYVRPIMRPVYPPEGWDELEPDERVPENVLVIDLIHRAVRRMFDGEGGEAPTAPEVAVINFSIGIRDRHFDGTMSPLARLLDWLSWKYSVLFVVSAGNHVHGIESGVPWTILGRAAPNELHSTIVRAIAADSRHRRLLSPSEAMNVVSIGAIHEDDDPAIVRHGQIDPVPTGFPSILNAQGLGYRRSVKPDVLAAGGRVQLRQPVLGSDTILHQIRASVAPGQRVASPGPGAGDLSHTAKSRGTSNATALMSRAAALLIPVLDELRSADSGHLIDAVPAAVWLKALLVHGARWGGLGSTFRELFRTDENSSKLAEYLTRLLGYGAVDRQLVSECTEKRVTALAGGQIGADKGFEHRFPLPPSLSGKGGWRCLVVTLAWLTPVEPRNHRYRRAHVWFESPQSKMSTGSKGHLRRTAADHDAVQRGTVQHEIFEGDRAAAFVDGDEIVIHVSCREDAPILSDSVSYALAVTLEVGTEIDVDIYSEVRARIQSKLRVAAHEAPF